MSLASWGYMDRDEFVKEVEIACERALRKFGGIVSEGDLDDLRQEGLLKCFETVERKDESPKERQAYLYGICRKSMLLWLSKYKNLRFDPIVSGEEGDYWPDMEGQIDRKRVVEAIIEWGKRGPKAST